MKKKIIVFAVIIIFALAIGILINKQYKQNKAQEQLKIENEYKLDFESLQLDKIGEKTEYLGVDAVNETKLMVALEVYNEDCAEKGIDESNIVTYEEIINYLSSEYAENGELFVLNRPEKIQEYENWYISYDVNNGEKLVQQFWEDVFHALGKYEEYHGDTQIEDVDDLTINQIHKLMEMSEANDYTDIL